MIVIRLQFNEVVYDGFAELNYLSLIERFFWSVCWTRFKTFIDNYWSQLNQTIFLCFFFRIILRVRKTPSTKYIAPLISIYITWTGFLL